MSRKYDITFFMTGGAMPMSQLNIVKADAASRVSAPQLPQTRLGANLSLKSNDVNKKIEFYKQLSVPSLSKQPSTSSLTRTKSLPTLNNKIDNALFLRFVDFKKNIQPSITELLCCSTDLEKIENAGHSIKIKNHFNFIRQLKIELFKFRDNIINSPVTTNMKSELSKIPEKDISEIMFITFMESALLYIEYITNQYLVFLNNLYNFVKTNNMLYYKISKNTRNISCVVNSPGCCDPTVNPSDCYLLYSAQKLIRLGMALPEFLKYFEKTKSMPDLVAKINATKGKLDTTIKDINETKRKLDNHNEQLLTNFRNNLTKQQQLFNIEYGNPEIIVNIK